MSILGSKRSLKFVYFLIFLCVVVFVVELLSWSAVRFVLGVERVDYATHYREDPQLRLLTWTEDYTPHPYFGYEGNLMRRSEKLLSEAGENDFVIGILGGSVAGGFAEYAISNPSHFESLRKAIPAFGEKTLRIVSLAPGGYKQPQQFFVAAYFMEKLDLIINIDGLNDADPKHLLPVYPLEFPNLSAKFYGRASQGGIYAVVGRTARWVYKQINRVPLQIPILSQSSSYFLGWHYLHDLLSRVVRVSEAAYYAHEFAVHQSEALRNTPPTEFMRKRIAIWKKYTVLEDDLLRKVAGKSVMFFLQPNQYLKDSKPFSEKEKNVAIDPSKAETTNEMMLLLKVAAEDLRRSGVPIIDLTTIFSNTHNTVYRDACCHLNDLGNQIMAEAVVSHFKQHQAESAPQAPRSK